MLYISRLTMLEREIVKTSGTVRMIVKSFSLLIIAAAAAMLASCEPGQVQTSESKVVRSKGTFPVSIIVDCDKPIGKLRRIWRFFGADEPNYATMKNGRKLLAALGQIEPTQVYFRTHNLLCSGDGTPALKWGSSGVYTEDANGEPIYDWKILDEIFDAYLQNGVRPYVQMGFMPKDLSIKPEPYQHKWTPKAKYDEIYTGWAYPPKDYDKWAELIYQWARHCVERYGRDEVETWYWETWNEANIGYWQGTHEEFCKLHDYAVDAVRRALPTARVGGPDVAGPGGKFQQDFIKHCLSGTNHATGKKGTPLDFVAFHAKGSPRFIDGHVRMGIANQLRDINNGFAIVASFPELKNTPIIIGESDPEGCAACQGEQLGYRNGTMYSSYTAASFARKLDLADRHGVNFEGALTWAFEFEDQAYFAGFRSLATNGIDKPVLNTFRMFGKMSGDRLSTQSDGAVDIETMLSTGVRQEPDVAALASLDSNKLCVMVWHYHDDDIAGPAADVELKITGLPEKFSKANLLHYRIDDKHSNAYSLWKRMGRPEDPSPGQYVKLEAAGQLTMLTSPKKIRSENGSAIIKFKLPRQGVSLLVMDWHR